LTLVYNFQLVIEVSSGRVCEEAISVTNILFELDGNFILKVVSPSQRGFRQEKRLWKEMGRRRGRERPSSRLQQPTLATTLPDTGSCCYTTR
jgi:hypothetical protein